MSSSELDTMQADTSPGALLRTAREQAGLNLREVAESLHLMPRQIEAIEQDDYDQFNGDIFCRGYIKAYAKLLAIDPQPLLAAYEQLCPRGEEKQLQAAKAKMQIQHPHKGRSIHYWSFAAMLLVALILWTYGSDEEVGLNNGFPDASHEVVVDKNTLINTSPVIDLPVLATADDVVALAETVELQIAEQSASNIDAQPLLAAATMELKADNEHSEDVFIVSSNDDNSLSFIFEDDCWVEVKDRDNKVIFANLKRANESLTLSGKPPFKVVLGYAHGVRVNYNGEPVSFDVNQQNNAAIMTIGRR